MSAAASSARLPQRTACLWVLRVSLDMPDTHNADRRSGGWGVDQVAVLWVFGILVGFLLGGLWVRVVERSAYECTVDPRWSASAFTDFPSWLDRLGYLSWMAIAIVGFIRSIHASISPSFAWKSAVILSYVVLTAFELVAGWRHYSTFFTAEQIDGMRSWIGSVAPARSGRHQSCGNWCRMGHRGPNCSRQEIFRCLTETRADRD